MIGLTTLPPSFAVVMKSRNLNFLEFSGPFQTCNGTALLFLHLINELNAMLCLFFFGDISLSIIIKVSRNMNTKYNVSVGFSC